MTKIETIWWKKETIKCMICSNKILKRAIKLAQVDLIWEMTTNLTVLIWFQLCQTGPKSNNFKKKNSLSKTQTAAENQTGLLLR